MRLKSSFVIFAVIKRVYLFVGEGWRILPGVVGYGIFTWTVDPKKWVYGMKKGSKIKKTLFNNFRAIVAIASERVPDDR